MAATNIEIIRTAYADLGRGFVEGYLGACHDDFVYCIAGHNALAGTHGGKAEFLELRRLIHQMTSGQFEEEVEDVLANNEHAIVLVTQRLTRGGMRWEYQSAHVYDIVHGQLVRGWEQPRSQSIFDQAWAEPL